MIKAIKILIRTATGKEQTPKVIFSALLILPALAVQAQFYGVQSSGLGMAQQQQMQLQQQQAAYAQQAAENAYQAEILAEQQQELALIYSKDPWRNVGGSTNMARGNGWVEFQGQVQDSLNDGTIFKGSWGQVLTIHPDPNYEEHLVKRFQADKAKISSGNVSVSSINGVQDTSVELKKIYGDDVFFVEGFPYPADKGRGYEQMMALDAGYYGYTNQNGQSLTIHKLIYGTPCIKVWSQQELDALKHKQDSVKQAKLDKLLKYNQDAADRGDAYGLLRMGERYRDGDGVPKDLTKARDYLTKASTAGSPSADDELKKLPTN